MDFVNFIGAGIAVGLSGIGVAIGEGILAKNSISVIGKRKDLRSFFITITILGIALVESAVIYGLIVAFQILGEESISLYGSIGAGLAIGLAGMGAGIGEGKLIGGALKAIAKNPEQKPKILSLMILFIALIESAAIYGLIVSFKILGDGGVTEAFIGMGLAVGFAGLGVSIGEGILAEKSIKYIGERKKMLGVFTTVTILGIALIESAAIYGLVVSFDILNKNLPLLAAIGSGLAIGLAGMGAGIGEGKLIGGGISAISRNPLNKNSIITFIILFVALVEVTAIYGLIISFKISGIENISDSLLFLGAGLCIGLAGLGVGIGRGYLSEESLKVMGKNPKIMMSLLATSILGVALVESAAIYALMTSFTILNDLTISGVVALGAGLAVGLTGLGAGVGEGLLIKGGIKGINFDPENKGKILAIMILFVALVESAAIYGLIIAFRAFS